MIGSPLVFSKIQIYFVFTVLITFLVIPINDADASRKRRRKISKNEIFTETISMKFRRKVRNYTISCHNGKGGRTRGKGKRVRFTRYGSLKRRFKKRGDKRKTKLFRKLAKKSRSICRAFSASESLKPYRGNFGIREARILHDRFGFSANFRQLQESVRVGLNESVSKLTTYVPEPNLESIMADYRCDRDFPWEDDNEPCSRFLPNNLSPTGIRESLTYGFINTKNPYFYRLWLFFHDERATAGLNNVDREEYYAIIDHIDMLMNAAVSGDLREFARTYNEDHIGSLKYLDNGRNDGVNPNENFAREFWQLHTTGDSYYNSQNQLIPVYGPLDIAQAALAHSGWTFTRITRDAPSGEYRMIIKAFSEVRQAPGNKIVFQGTPYEAVVFDADELAEATFRHPAFAQSYAQELIQLFIKPDPSPRFVKRAAQILRNNGFNIHALARVLAKSEALYSKANEKNILKSPYDKIIGFLRATNYPYLSISHLDRVLSSMEQKILSPESVFGFNEEELESQANTIRNRNGYREILSRLYRTTPDPENPYAFYYSFYDNLTFDLYRQAFPAKAFVDRLSKLLGVEPANVEQVIYYLDYRLVTCRSSDPECDDEGRKYVRDVFDPHPDNDSSSTYRRRLLGLLLAFVQTGEYSLK